MARYTGLDFETFSEVNLPVHSLDRYVDHPSFRPLIASIDDGVRPPMTFDFVMDGPDYYEFFREFKLATEWGYVAAHNVGFERAVLRWMKMSEPFLGRTRDSAVVARQMGAGSSLEAAAPQLVGIDKMAVGKELIQLFSVPNERNQGRPFTREEILADPELLTKWNIYKEYCEIDATGSRLILETYDEDQWSNVRIEGMREFITARMNEVGWFVDLPLVTEMKVLYEKNLQEAESAFHRAHDPQWKLNLSSTMQLRKWCEDRGIRAKSFDKESVDKMYAAVSKRFERMKGDDPKYLPTSQVLDLLHTKQVMGGTSLKKLTTILNTVGNDGRLRNQYMHIGAGQTYRTSGKGVQLQNLKRLDGENLLDMDTVYDNDELTNDDLATNLRQVFRAEHPDGQLIVGDFKSVESRGLAWVAGADWKTNAYRQGLDLYVVQAASIYGIDYDAVTKPQRQTGKLGELSCGYGAGPSAVTRFAGKMGIDMDEPAALQLVRDWRATNPETVELWDVINELIHKAVQSNQAHWAVLANGLELGFVPTVTPKSLSDQHPGATSIEMILRHSKTGDNILRRVFHGCYVRGRNICFYKPSERKTGDLWSSHFTDDKTKKTRFYEVYGGKLAGILVQSMCREMFFQSLEVLSGLLLRVRNVKLIGQFHDEIVLEWTPDTGPNSVTLEEAQEILTQAMTTTNRVFKGFPLEADIKHDHRYTK